jgi:hypothetical protein
LSRRTQIVTDTLLRELKEKISSLRARGTSIAYLLTLPTDSTSVQWSAVRRVLIDTLRARQPTDADSLIEVLRVEVQKSSPKAIQLRLFIGAEWRCDGKWLGGGSERDVFVPWHRAAKPPDERMFRASDSAPCRDR